MSLYFYLNDLFTIAYLFQIQFWYHILVSDSLNAFLIFLNLVSKVINLLFVVLNHFKVDVDVVFLKLFTLCCGNVCSKKMKINFSFNFNMI
jgi:hypothetical protein